MKRIAMIVVTIFASLALMPAAKASAYLHVANGASTCYQHLYPSAQANLAPWGGQSSNIYGYTRSSDTSILFDFYFFPPGSPNYLGSNGHYYYLSDRLQCRITGNDPGTVQSISDWGVAYRDAYTFP